MVNVGQLILKTFERKDTVDIPEVGTVKRIYQPSTFNPQDNSYSPPISSVLLEENINTGYAQLCEIVSKEANLTIAEAEEAVRVYVGDLKTKVAHFNEFHIKGLGTIVFENRKFAIKGLNEKNSNAHFGLEEYKTGTKKRRRSEKQKANRKAAFDLFKLVSMIPVLLFLAYVIFSFYKHGGLVLPKISWFTGKEKAAIVVQDTLQNMSPIVTDTISNDSLRSLENNTLTPTTVSTSIEPEKSLETKPKEDINSKENNKISDENVAIVKSAPIPSYIIVGGSFKSEKNAREYVKKLRAKGYANASVQGKNELGEYIVAFNIYKNRNEAVESLTNIKNNIQPSAWIMTR